MCHYRSAPVVVGIIGLLACKVGWAADASGIRSDDFNSCQLDGSTWSVLDPLGGAGIRIEGVGTTNARLLIAVPAGVLHELSASYNNTVRVFQPAANVNFEVRAKIDSHPAAPGQFQGIIIEQGPARFLRFQLEGTGRSSVLSSATYFGKEDTRRKQTLSLSTPIWLLIRRQADRWTLQYSYTGQTWLDHKSFSQAMTVTRVGLYAGNSATGSVPEMTAQFDCFLNPAEPFEGGEDAIPRSPAATLTRNVTGRGRIVADPDRTAYYCSEAVTVMAMPDPGWVFQGWSGDLSGNNPVQSIAMVSSQAVIAAFVEEAGAPPVITGVQIAPSETSARIIWLTDKPSTSRVTYGRTAEYELGPIEDAALTTSHSVTLTGLSAQTTYHCRLFSSGADGLTGASSDLTFATASGTSGISSDDFNSCTLNPATWSVVDPLGGGTVRTTGAGTQNAYLQITVPAGASHDMWINEFNGVRAMQIVPNTDFEVVAKFESTLNQRYQFQGLFIEQNDSTSIRYDVLHDGTGASLYSATFAGTTAIAHREQAVTNSVPIWLAVRRQQSQFTLRYSLNGTTWLDHTSFSFPMTVTRMGPYAGNYHEQYAPAFTAKVDYVLNAAAPFSTEDGPLPGGFTLTRNIVGSGTVSADPDAPLYNCSERVILRATPTSGYRFEGWTGDVTSTSNPIEVQMDGNKTVTATFAPVAGTVQLLDRTLSTAAARDGQVIRAGYFVSGPASTSVTLSCQLTDPSGRILTDQQHNAVVTLGSEPQWYYRDFLVNLGPGPTYGLYDVVWELSWPSGNVSVSQPKGLALNSPVAMRVPILMYHYFGPEAYTPYFVRTQEFRNQMIALRAYGYTSMFFHELMDCRAGLASIPSKPVLITIDDGCRNQYTDAFPVLADTAINMKATSFVLVSTIGQPDPLYAGLSWDEMQTMQASGHVDVQSHTVTHPYLSSLGGQALMNELMGSKLSLETGLNKPVRFIGYPYGDANSAVQNAAWQAGYVAGIGAFGGVEQNASNKWYLSRVNIDSSVKVEYDPAHPENFFFTLIGDPDVVIPKLLINAIQVRDAETDRPLSYGVAARGQKLRVRVVAANWGPGATVVASLALSNRGVVYDSHDVGEDVTTMFHPGPKVYEWDWSVPSTAAAGHYSLSVVFRDVPYVLTWERSEWQPAFQIRD